MAIPALPETLPEARGLLDRLPTNALPLHVDADFVELPAGGSQAIVRVQTPLSNIAWQKVEGRHRASVEWIGGVYDPSGTPVGVPFSRRSDLDLTAVDYDRAVFKGLRYQQALPLQPGRYQIRLVARDGKGRALGSASKSIEIPDLTEKKLTLSGVFLSSGGGETLNDAQIFRRFKRGATVYFQLYVYNATFDDNGASDVVLQAQLRSGDKLVGASRSQAVTLVQKDGAPIPQTGGMSLEGLPAGPYELRIVVFDGKANVRAERNMDLTLE